MVRLLWVRRNKSPTTENTCTAGAPGLGAMSAEELYKYQLPNTAAATQSDDARAPHLVLRFQNSAANMIGASAAYPENAKRTASSKMPALSLSRSAIQ